MNTDLENAVGAVIKKRSHVLAKFSPPQAIQYSCEEMEKLLWGWCRNFEGLLHDYSLLADLVREIEIVEDNDIIEAFYQSKDVILPENEKHYYCCPFGESSASSHRITASLHKDFPSYNDSLPNLLDQIKKQAADTGKYPHIIFIDDFLNSGGQFKRVINSWIANTEQADANFISAPEIYLTDMQIETLQKCGLDFFFYLCKENKRVELERLLQNIFPHGRIYVHKTIPEYGIFGDNDDVNKIISKSDEYISKKSIFSGKTGKELFDLYFICKEAGVQLLRANEKDWAELKIQERSLGYGNSPQLYIGQNNVPTFTMTALWQEGNVNINGKNIFWKRMFPRRKKITSSPENHVETVKIIPKLDRRGKDSSHSFEVHIIGELEKVSPEFMGESPSSSDTLKSYFLSEFIDSMDVNLITIPKECYRKYNNHLKWFVSDNQDGGDEKCCPVFISRIQLLQSDIRTIFSVYLIINAEGLTIDRLSSLLKQAREIKYKTKKWDNGFLSLKIKLDEFCKLSFPELLTNIFNDMNCKVAKENLFLLYFMRFDSSSQSCDKLPQNHELMRIITLNSATNCFNYYMKEAAVAVTEKVGAFICKNYPINNSGALQKEVADVYCTLEMLSRRFIKLAQFDHFNIQPLSERDKRILKAGQLFFQKPYSCNDHVKKYMMLLQKRMAEYINDNET